MNRTGANLGIAVRVIFLVLLAFLSLFGSLFLIFFVPVVGWFLLRDQDRIAKLEQKLAALEKPYMPDKPES